MKIKKFNEFFSNYDMDGSQFKFRLSEQDKRGSAFYIGRNVIWYGSPSQMIYVHKDDIVGMYGNIYDNDKLQGVVSMVSSDVASVDKVEFSCSYAIGGLIMLSDIIEEQSAYHGGRFEIDYDGKNSPSTTGDVKVDQYLGTEYMDSFFQTMNSDYIDIINEYKLALAYGKFVTSEELCGDILEKHPDIFQDEDELLSEIGEFIEIEERLYDIISKNKGDLGKFEVQLRDGHHRVMGSIEAGEIYVCVNLDEKLVKEYKEHINLVIDDYPNNLY